MTERTIDSALKTSLLNNESFIYYNLIKFERPQISGSDGEVSKTAIDYSYLTDAPYNIPWDDSSGNGEQLYIANKVLSLGAITESMEAKATTMTLKLSTSALGSYLYSSPTFNGTSKYLEVPTDLALEGFREGDKILLTSDLGTNDGYFVRFDRFTNEGPSGIRNSRVYFSELGSTISTESGQNYTLTIESEELRNLTRSKTGEVTAYASYLNREVFIYRVHANPTTGEIIGTPFLLFKGIISASSLDEQPERESSISWGLTSHWGDFVRSNGRLTSDSAHRALSATGRPDISSIHRSEYATDYGFMHAERAVNVMAEFTYKELRYKYKDASFVNKLTFGLFGSGPKMKEEWVDVERDVDLRFNLNARHLPVVYGVQLVENNPIFVDVNKTNPAEVYIAYAICEGEIGGVYDVYIEDQPSICIDDADENTRGANNTYENSPDVVCWGRADKGEVLTGSNYLDTNTSNIKFNDITDPDYSIRPFIGGAVLGRRIYTKLIGSQYNFPGGANKQKGIGHEETFSFTTPITASLILHTGKPDQEANQELLEMAQSNNFKVQSNYFKGDPSNYWSTSHRLLDTAYVVGRFTLSEGEESLPEFKFVVKGKYINCYNYDHSFKKVSGDAASNFNIGDTVTIDGGNTEVHTNVQIIDKWTMVDKDGNEDVRFRWQTDWPNSGDTLVDFSDNQEIVMTKGGFTWTMRPATYKTTDAATVTSYPTATISPTTIDYIQDSNGNASALEADFSGASFLSLVTEGGANNVYISPASNRNVAFLVTGISGNTLSFAPYSLGYELLNRYKDDDFIVSNALSGSHSAEEGNTVIVYKNVNGIVEEKTKEIKTISTGTIFTKSPFAKDFYPESGDTFDTIWEYKDLRVSINPALQLLDYATSTRYGQGLDIENDINLESWLEAARLCDDRSKVKIVTTTGATPGDIYYYEDGSSRLIFQGTVSSSVQHGSYYEIEFDNVIGKLGYKWNTWRNYTAGDLVWYNDYVIQASGGIIPNNSVFNAGNALSSISLTRIGGGSLTVNLDRLGGLTNTNPIVRSWSDADQAFTAPGYSLYDSDEVVYWKYLGWDEPEQRCVTRHQMNQIINTSGSIFDNINSMLAQFNGILRYVNGKYDLDIRSAAPPITSMEPGVHKISEEDIIGNIRIDDKGQKRSYNSISASIFDPQNKFASRSVTFFDSTYLKEDRGIPKQGKLGLGGITNYYGARNNVVQFLKESRYGLTINFTMDQKGYLLLPGEIIALSYSRFNWLNKYFRIETSKIQTNGIVQLTAKEHNDDAYLIDYADRDISYSSGSFSGEIIIAPPTSLVASDTLDGVIQLTWNNSSEYDPDLYDIEIWAVEAVQDSTGDYILESDGDPLTSYNTFSNATLLDKTDGTSYIHVMTGAAPANYLKHRWYYWIRYVKPPVAYRAKALYSKYTPTTINPGAIGEATEALADTARSVALLADTLVVKYDAAGDLLNPTTSDITFTAVPFSVVGTPTYDFIVTDVNGTVVTSESPTGDTFIYSPPLTFESDSIDSRWMPETVQVKLYEDGDLAAVDYALVQGLSDSSEAIHIEISNSNTFVSLNAEQVADYTNTPTKIRVWEGSAELRAMYDSDPENLNEIIDLDNGQFVVMIESITPAASLDIVLPFYDVGNTITTSGIDNMTVEYAEVEYRVRVKRFNGAQTDFNVTQYFKKERSYASRSSSLIPSDISIVYNIQGTTPVYQGDSVGVVLTARSTGYTDPYYRLLKNGSIYDDPLLTEDGSGWVQAGTNDELDFHYIPPSSITPGTVTFELETKEAGASASSSDVVSIFHVQNGSEGLYAGLTNPTHVVTANSDGTGYDLTDAGGVFEIFEGGVDVSDQTVFQVNDADPDTSGLSEWTIPGGGLTFTIESGTSDAGTYYLTDTTDSWEELSRTFNLTATYNGIIITRKYTITKAIAGVNTYYGSLDYDSSSVQYDDTDTPSPTVVNITLTGFNYKNPEYAFWSELDEIYTDPIITGASYYGEGWSSDNTAVFNCPASFNDWYGPCAIKGYIREVDDNSTLSVIVGMITPYTSSYSALEPTQDNQFVQLSEAGGTINYSGSGNTISVYEGTTKLLCNDSKTLAPNPGVADKWYINSQTYGGGLATIDPAPGWTQTSGGDALVEGLNAPGVDSTPWDPALLDTYVAWCDYELHIRRESESEGYVTRVIRQTFQRNAPGADGETVGIVQIYNRVCTIPTESGAVGYLNADWSNSGTDIEVFYGTTKLAYNTTPGTNTWRITSISDVPDDPDITPTSPPGAGSNGATTITISPHNSGSSDSAWDTTGGYAEIIYAIVAEGPDGTEVINGNFKQTFTRVPGGLDADGKAAINIVLSNDSHALPVNPDGVVLDTSGAGTEIFVYYGDELLTPTTQSDQNLMNDGEWYVSAAGSGTLSPGTKTVDVPNKKVTYGDNITGFVGPTESITFTIYGTYPTDVGGGDFPNVGAMTKVQSLTSSTSAASIRLTANSYVVSYNEDGNLTSPDIVLTVETSGGVDTPYYAWDTNPEDNDGPIYDTTELNQAFSTISTRTWSSTGMPDTYDEWLSAIGGSLEVVVTLKDNKVGNVLATDTVSLFPVKGGLDGYWADIVGETLVVNSSADLLQFPVGGFGYVLNPSTGTGHVGRMSVYHGNTDVSDQCTWTFDGSPTPVPDAPNDVTRQEKNGLYGTLFYQDDNIETPDFTYGHFLFQGRDGSTFWDTESERFIIKATHTSSGLVFKKEISCTKVPDGLPGLPPPQEDDGATTDIVSLASTRVVALNNNGATANCYFYMGSNGNMYTSIVSYTYANAYHKWLESGTNSNWEVQFTHTGTASILAPDSNWASDNFGSWVPLSKNYMVHLSATSNTKREDTITVKLRSADTGTILAVATINMLARSVSIDYNLP